jgi:hypothetical protein
MEQQRALRALTKKTDPQNAPLDINDVINDVVGLVLREVLSHRVRLKRDLVTALNRIIGDRCNYSRSSSFLSRIALKPWQTSQSGSVSS